MNAEPEFTLCIAPGTHDDLSWQFDEWYVRHVVEDQTTGVIDALRGDSRLRFILDGQAELALWRQETASVYPDEGHARRTIMRELVTSGQLEVGPAMVILDEFLAPETALLMNPLMGQRVTRELGGKIGQVFDMSDAFGHVAQGPQVYRAFSPHIMFSRGMSAADLHHNPVIYRWVAPDGTEIIAVPQQGGYQSGRFFARGKVADSIQVVQEFLDKYTARYRQAEVNRMLMYARKDYGELSPNFMEHFEAVQQHFPNIKFEIVTNSQYVEGLQLDTDRLPLRSGELVGSTERFVLRGVNSSRMPLKLANERVYRALISAETAACLARLSRDSAYKYPHLQMHSLWRSYLVLQSHDAITGCHSDVVFRNMMYRFGKIEEYADWLMQEALAALASRKAVPNHDSKMGRAATDEFALLSLLPYKRQEVAIVPLPESLLGERNLKVLVNGKATVAQRLGETDAAIQVNVGSFGSALVQFSHDGELVGSKFRGGQRSIENEHLLVEVARNGTVKLKDKATGRQLKDLHWFESIGDCGDTYTYAPVAESPYDSRQEQQPAKVTVLANGPLVWELLVAQTLHLPKHLDAARTARVGKAEVTVKTVLRLRKDSTHLEFETAVNNHALDHRLRVVFPVGETVPSSSAQTAFMVQEYPIRPPLDLTWKEHSEEQEPPFNAITNQGLVIAGPVFTANRGITEYEASDTADGTDVRYTLLRCNSHLSQGELSTRRGQAGPSVEVPDAQCQGRHAFSYILGFVGASSEVEHAQAAQAWRNGFVRTYAAANTTGIIDVDYGQSVFSSLMPAQDGQGVVLRQWAGAQGAKFSLSGSFSSVTRLELNEVNSEETGTDMAPYKIGVYRLH